MSQPPPPRYTIVEQGRRLIVTDNWARAKTRRAPPILPPRAGRDLTGPARNIAANRIVRAGDEGGALLRRLALMACIGAEDSGGRPIFSTVSAFDTKGPREFSLGPAGVRRLGGSVLAVLGLIALVVLLAALIGFEIFFLVFVLLIIVGKNIGALATRWIDWIERASVD